MQNDKVLFAGTNFSFMDDVRPAGFLADGREIVLYLSGISVIING